MEEEPQINPDDYKGKLPVYMRQGIPPYLQILFAARPQLPFLPPIQKPHKLHLRGLFEDKAQLDSQLTKLAQMKKDRLEKEKTFKIKEKYKNIISTEDKEKKWFERMKNHISNKREEFKNWMARERYVNSGKTGNPFQTVLVHNLVG